MRKICMLMPYFGKWPEWIDSYLETCRYNPTIDWLFFTDCGTPDNRVDNIKYVTWSLQDFNILASKKTDCKIEIENPYLLCDLRPAYGVIFEDYLSGYDFWGHGDIDVIYGNLRRFITDDILDRYEIISSRKERLTGHFCLYKNNAKINNLYKRVPGYKTFFQMKQYAWTDEEHMANLIRRLTQKYIVKVLFRDIMESDTWPHREKWKIYWNKGRLWDTATGEELAYFHFAYSKKAFNLIIHDYQEAGDNFCLSGSIPWYKNQRFHRRLLQKSLFFLRRLKPC